MKLRKALSLFLAVIMVLSVIPLTGINAFADIGFGEWGEFNGFEYYLDFEVGGVVKITGYTGTETNITIPSEIKGYPVKCINRYAFKNCTLLESITIPDGVWKIGNNAFDDTAYYKDESNWENGVLYIGKYLIKAKTDLGGKYSIKEGTETIADWAFDECKSLTSVTLPDSVTYIGYSAFDECTSLVDVTIGRGVMYISWNDFSTCDSMQNIYVSTDNENYCDIDGILFNKDVTQLIFCPQGKSGSYEIPDSVTELGEDAFRECSLITKITIPDGVTCLDSLTFDGCTSLESITIPDSVTDIGNVAFRDTAYYKDESNWENDVLYIGNHLIEAKRNIRGEYSIKEGTKTIADAAFYECKSLTSVTIPNSVTRISYGVFSGCKSLTSVTLGNGVTSIGSVAFKDCTSLESIIIPDSVTSIGWWAFSNCTSLESIIIPLSVMRIDSNAFDGCTSMVNIYVDAENENYCDIDGVVFNKAAIELTLCPEGKSGSYVIPDSVTSIGEYAFSDCALLENVTIPDSVTSIGEYAFNGCENLTIYGYSGSYAETYAKENSISFVSIGIAAPKLSKIANTAKGVTVSWSKISGATSYNVYRKAGNATSWTRIASVTGTSYTDSNVSSGTKYTYTVRAVNGSDMSGFDANGISILRLAQPAFKVDNQNGYVRVAWNKVAGAKGYYVYRKAPNAKSWTRIATVTGTAYNDKNVKSGTNYVYTVRAYNGNVSSSFHSGVAIKYLARPTFKVANQNGYVRVAWNKVAGATGYYVYRKAPNAKSWTRIATVSGTAYADKSVKSGSNYVYTVRTFNGNVSSSYHSGVAIKYLARPTFKVDNQNGYVRVAWNKVAGATGYYVYRKAPNAKSWTRIATVSGTAYNDKNVKSGSNYVYTVRAFNGKFTSTFHSGVAIKYLARPTFKVANKSNNVTVAWSKIAGAKGYYVYRKAGNATSWTKVATVTGTAYADKNVKKNVKYTYTVKAYNGKYTSTHHSGAGVKH